jgi:cellulose synthase operon protein C
MKRFRLGKSPISVGADLCVCPGSMVRQPSGQTHRSAPTLKRALLFALIAIHLGLAAFYTQRTRASVESHPAKDERATLVENALYARGEFFGAQALVPYPTAEARARLAEVQQKYPNDSAILARLAQLDEKLGAVRQAEQELRRYIELERNTPAALEVLAAFYDRQARFADEAATLEKLLRAAAPDARPPILQRLMELARIHALQNYLKPDFYEQLVAADPSVFEIVKQLIDRLSEQKRYAEALRVIATHKSRFTDQQAYFLEKESEVLLSLGRTKEAEVVYVKAFDPFWPKEIAEDFYDFLSRQDRLRAYGRELKEAFRRRPNDFNLAVRLFHYSKHYDQTAGIFTRLEKARAASRWTPEELATAARLLVADGETELASRFLYTLYAQGGLKPGSVLRATVLYQLFKLLEEARYERTILTAGDLKLYREVATADVHPGLLGGVLSLILADSQPQREFKREQEIAVKYFNRAAAYRIFTVYKQEYPTSPELAQMYLDLVRLCAATSEMALAAETLAEFEQRYGDAPQFAEVALKLADAYIQQGDFAKERALYQRTLDYLGKQRQPGTPLVATLQPRQNNYDYQSAHSYLEPSETAPALIHYPPASNLGIRIIGDEDEVLAPSSYYYDSSSREQIDGWEQARQVTYSEVLERYVASLAKERRNADILALYAGELKKYPDEQGLCEQLLQWLSQTNLVEEQLRVYQQALTQFPETTWYDRLARWLLRRQRTAEFEQFSRELLAKFADHETERYLSKFVQSGASANAAEFEARLYLGLYQLAHERFPHNLNFVQGLLRYYSARNQWTEWRALLAEYYCASREVREQFLAHLASKNELRTYLDRARRKLASEAKDAASLTVYQLFCADAAAWLSNYEEAIDAYRELNRRYPNTPEYAERLIAFTRSFGQQNTRFLEEAAAAQHALAEAVPSSALYRTQAGEIYAELGDYTRAHREWQQLIKLGRGEPETYQDTATVYWDYFQYGAALDTIKALRREMNAPNMYAYQAGAILEAQHRMQQALAEYAKEFDENAEHHRSAMRRLRILYARQGMPAQIGAAFAREWSKARDRDSLVLGYADFLRSVKQRKAASILLKRQMARSRNQDFFDQARNIFEAEGDDGGVIYAFKKSIVAAKNDRFAISYRLRLAEAYAVRGQRGAAAAALAESVRAYPVNYGVLSTTADFYWRLGLRDNAVRVLTRGVRQGRGKFQYIFARKLAAREIERGRLAAAERVLRPLYDKDKLNLSVFQALTNIYVRTTRPAALRQLAREAIDAIRHTDLDRRELHDQIAVLREQLIGAFTQLKDYRAAMEQHVAIINRDPDDADKLTAAIQYAKRCGGADELLAYYRRTAEQAYKDYRWNLVLARIYEAKGELGNAAAQYQQALVNQPEMIELHSALANVYLRAQDYDRALAALDRARELSNDDPQYLRLIADTLVKAGREREAEAVRQKLPKTQTPSQALGDQFAEAARLRATDRTKSAAVYRRAFDLFLSDIYKHELKAHELVAYVQTVRAEESLETILGRLWELRARLGREAARKDNLAVGKARNLIGTVEQGLIEGVGGVARDYATSDELEAVYQLLQRWTDEALRDNDKQSTLALLRNLSERAGLSALGEKTALAQKDLSFATGDHRLYHAQLRTLIRFYDDRGAYQRAVKLLVAEAAHDRARGEFEYTRLIAEHARLIGDRERELETLRAYYRSLSGSLTTQADPLLQRYFEALLEAGESGLNELRACAQQPSPYHFQLIRLLLAHGQRELAREAIQHAPLPEVWKQARLAEFSLALRDFAPERESHFISALHWQTIGEMLSDKPDAARELVGDDWFRLSESYGRWLSAAKYAKERETSPGRTFLPALIENRPKDGAEQWRLGRWYLAQGDARRALEHLGFALEMKPDDRAILADLGSAFFLSGDRPRAEKTWTRIIAADKPTPGDCETYLNVLAKHGLAAEARQKLLPIISAELQRITFYEASYWDRDDKDFEALKPLLRALAASFAPQPDAELSPQTEAAKANFFRQLCAAVPESLRLPEMLLDETVIHSSQRGPFFQMLIERSEGLSSYQRDTDFIELLRSFWSAPEAEAVLDHKRDFKGEASPSDRLKWRQEYLDYLFEQRRNAEALAAIVAAERELKGRFPRPAWLRLARFRAELRAARNPQVPNELKHFTGSETPARLTLVKPPNLERLNQATALLRSEGRAAEAQELLKAAHERLLALEQYQQASFVSLAQLAFEKGETAQALALLRLLIELGREETKAAAAAEVAALPAIKARAIDDPTVETPAPNNSIQLAEALRLAAETAAAFGQFDAALDYGRQLLSVNPADEAARSELVRLLAAKGQTAEAIDALAAIIGDHLATRQLRWTAVWLAPEIIGGRSEQWGLLEERVRAINAKDTEMATALRALAQWQHGQPGEAVKLVNEASARTPNAQLIFFRALLQERNKQREATLRSALDSLLANREPAAFHAFAFSDDEPRWQLIRLYAALGQPRAALRVAEADTRLQGEKQSASANIGSDEALLEVQANAIQLRARYQSLVTRAAERQAQTRLELLEALSAAGEQVGEFSRAADYERALLNDLSNAEERRKAVQRSAALLVRQREKTQAKLTTLVIDERPVSERVGDRDGR